MIDLVSVLNAIGSPRNFAEEQAKYKQLQEQGTRLNEIGNLRNMFAQGTPDKQAILNQYAKVDPMLGAKNILSQQQTNPEDEMRAVTQLGIQLRNQYLLRASDNWENFGEARKNQIEANIDRMEGALKGTTLGAQMIGEVQQEVEQKNGVALGDVGKGIPSLDVEAVQDEIKNMLKVKDGIIENDADINAFIDVKKNAHGLGESDSEIKRIRGYYDRLSKTELAKDKRAEEKRKIGKGDIDRRISQDEKFQWLFKPFKNLKENPEDKTAKGIAIMSALRKESGAAIAASEFRNAMKVLLPEDKYEEFIQDATGLNAFIAKGAGLEDAYVERLVNKYIGFADSDKILNNYLGPKIPQDYYQAKEYNKTKSAPKVKMIGGWQ